MVKQTLDGRTAAEIVERAEAIQRGHHETWRSLIELNAGFFGKLIASTRLTGTFTDIVERRFEGQSTQNPRSRR